MLARCIQHEYDHLNGILFINKVDEKKREKILSALEKKAKKQQKKQRR